MNLTDLNVKIFKALAHPIRLKIIKKLNTDDMCVCKLNEDIEFSQSNLSQHLKILKDAGILISRKEGLWMHYQVKNTQILDLIDLAEKINIKNFDLQRRENDEQI